MDVNYNDAQKRLFFFSLLALAVGIFCLFLLLPLGVAVLSMSTVSFIAYFFFRDQIIDYAKTLAFLLVIAGFISATIGAIFYMLNETANSGNIILFGAAMISAGTVFSVKLHWTSIKNFLK